ncbi:11264_t:CDS:2 [Paraglomus occultum]|uniref:11264_t:CDS:1 n=1 Tax=Paraglomus occultum TaxID=144539 RepID=A0A9N8WEV9_9GLOM|nr:11264_t:CDS:2 [Paraglomus occultum]
MSAEENCKDETRDSWIELNLTPVQSICSDDRYSQHTKASFNSIENVVKHYGNSDKRKSWVDLIAPYPTLVTNLLNHNRESKNSSIIAESKHSSKYFTPTDSIGEQITEDYNRELSKNEKTALVIVMSLVVFLASIEVTAVLSISNEVASFFDNFESYRWPVTAYLITFCTSQPICGKLSEIFDRKPIILFATAIFLFGTLGTGAATSMSMFIAFRTLQGLGGGSMLCIARIIVFDIEKGTKYSTIITVIYGSTTLIGPIFGILFANEHWQWIFYMNVAMGIFLQIALVLLMHTPHESKPFLAGLKSFNYIEIFSQISCVTCFLSALALIAENNQKRGQEGNVPALFISSAIFLIIFIYLGKKATNPLIPREFWNKEILVASACALFTGITFALVACYVPLYCRVVQHASASDIGVNIFALLLGFVATSIVSAALVRRLGLYGSFLVVGGLFNVIGFGILIAWNQYTHGAGEYMCLFLIGLGMGCILHTNLLATQSVGKRYKIISSTWCQFVTTTGVAIGITMFAAILQTGISANFHRLDSESATEILALSPQILLTYDTGKLPEKYVAIMLDNFGRAFRAVFICVTLMACSGLIFGILFSFLHGATAQDCESHISTTTTASTCHRYNNVDNNNIQVDVTEVKISKVYAQPPRKHSTVVPLSYAIDHGNGQTYNSRRVTIFPVQQ